MKKLNTMVNDAATADIITTLNTNEKNKMRNEILFLVGALVSLFTGLIYKRIFPEQDVVVSFIYLLGVLIIGLPIIITAAKGFIKNDITASMEILVAIAIVVSVIDNQYILAILIPIILTLVHFLEEKSIIGGRDAIESLKKIQVSTALLLNDGEETQVPAKSLQVGDLICIKAGMAVPIDGVIVSGTSSLNQQSLTGESQPVYVSIGEKVFAGTTNIDGVLNVEVTKEYNDTSFQQIVTLLEQTQNTTVAESRIIDKFMMYYLPTILIIATMVWLLTQDISRAIAILVVSCPCGYMLVTSAPMLAAFANGTKHGILIKNASFIDKLSGASCMVFDKTGTITKGYLEAINYHLEKAASYEELVSLANSVAYKSLHPVSHSIATLCENISFEKDFEVTEYIGKGVIGTKGDTEIKIGSYRWFQSLGFNLTDKYESEGATTWVAKNNALMGCLLFRDIAREDATEMMEELVDIGIRETVLLTGDNATAAERIKTAVGFDTMYSHMLPEDKLNKVKMLKENHTVVVVGDGINDSLALSEADVGIAMGAMGSDTAIQSADIALMSNNLANIPFIIRLAKKTKDAIMQNIVIAFFTSFIMIVLAATGIVSAIVGAILHNIGAFIVLINSGKILKIGKNEHNLTDNKLGEK